MRTNAPLKLTSHLLTTFRTIYLLFLPHTLPLRLFLGGDFNFSTINWHNPFPPCSKSMSNCKDFIVACLGFNHSQIVCSPTRVPDSGFNVLDLVFTSIATLSSSYLPQPILMPSGITKPFSFLVDFKIDKPAFVKKKTRLHNKGLQPSFV